MAKPSYPRARRLAETIRRLTGEWLETERADQPGARRAHWVAERAGAAVDVDLVALAVGHLELAHQCDRGAGEGFVDLDDRHILHRETRALQRLMGGRDG